MQRMRFYGLVLFATMALAVSGAARTAGTRSSKSALEKPRLWSSSHHLVIGSDARSQGHSGARGASASHSREDV